MKETPITMSTEEVRAILEDRKTQTRWVIKPQPFKNLGSSDNADLGSSGNTVRIDLLPYSPYGHLVLVGDRLWVRRNKEGKFIWRKTEADIWLEITGLRAERLQEISEEDAIAEGISRSERTGRYLPSNCDYARWSFEILWDSHNAKRGHPWANNDWVQVIEFKRVLNG